MSRRGSKENNLLCGIHRKNIEGYCKECQVYICSSCLFGMNNAHKSHNLLSLEELADLLREMIHENSALLQYDYCYSKSIDILQAKAEIEKQANQLIERIQKETEKLISVISMRKAYIIQKIKDNLQIEVDKINAQTEKWKRKTEIATEINKLQVDFNDQNVYSNMEKIIIGLKILREPLKTYEYSSITDYSYNLQFNNTKFHYDELLQSLNNMYKINNEDVILIPYKA